MEKKDQMSRSDITPVFVNTTHELLDFHSPIAHLCRCAVWYHLNPTAEKFWGLGSLFPIHIKGEVLTLTKQQTQKHQTMNSAWRQIFKKKQEEKSSFVCDFCQLRCFNAGALAKHAKIHNLETSEENAKRITDAFSNLPKLPRKRQALPKLPAKSRKKKRKRTSNKQKKKFLDEYLEIPDAKKFEWRKENQVSKQDLKRIKRRKTEIIGAAKSGKTGNMMCIPTNHDTSRFQAQQKHLLGEIGERRRKGLIVDGEYIQGRFKQILAKDQPVGWEKAKACNGWKDKFVKRHSLSSQRKTNNKPRSAEERIEQIRRFHQYSVYGVPFELPSPYKNHKVVMLSKWSTKLKPHDVASHKMWHPAVCQHHHWIWFDFSVNTRHYPKFESCSKNF